MKNKLIPTKIYKIIMNNVPICCIDIIFLNKLKNKILLFNRNNEPVKNVYFTIGGRLLKGENFIEGAVRQAKRELNLKINPKKLFFIGATLDNHKNSFFKKISYHAVSIFFGYILDKEKLYFKFDKQHNNCKWFSVKDKTLHPYIKERVKQTLFILKK